MATINSVETGALEQLWQATDGTGAWAGTDELRGYVIDAIDETCILGKFFEHTFHIVLKEGIFVYKLLPITYTPVFIQGVYSKERNLWLEPTSMGKLSRWCPGWLGSSGPPSHYVVLDFSKILVYPGPAADGGTLDIKCSCIPGSYSDGDRLLEVRRELHGALVDYVVAHAYMRVANRFKDGIELYKSYLTKLGKIPGFKGGFAAAQFIRTLSAQEQNSDAS